MTQNREYEQKYSKKISSKRGAITNTNNFSKDSISGVRKPDSFKVNSGKYDGFGRVSKSHTIHPQKKKNEKIDKNGPEIEQKIGSEKCNSKDISSISESELIKEMFGIEKFETSKNKSHSASSLSGFNAKSRRKYRQYMNRSGGFNRPLSPVQ